MLPNLVGLEEAILRNSLMYDDTAVVFEAAFPSVCQDFLLDVIKSQGRPPW